ncbi:MAG: hypothetical protein IJ233_11690 [Pyramidobacter sp.]|nr:hypothetical protein [Pyramidobacter sp.]
MAELEFFELPLVPEPQTLTISLGDVEYGLRLRWNDHAGLWILDISDADGNAIVTGISLVTGVDLLEQYQHLSFGGSLYAYENDTDVPPSFDTLGTSGGLVWATEAVE